MSQENDNHHQFLLLLLFWGCQSLRKYEKSFHSSENTIQQNLTWIFSVKGDTLLNKMLTLMHTLIHSYKLLQEAKKTETKPFFVKE